MKSSALSLALIMRSKTTRKWPITVQKEWGRVVEIRHYLRMFKLSAVPFCLNPNMRSTHSCKWAETCFDSNAWKINQFNVKIYVYYWRFYGEKELAWIWLGFYTAFMRVVTQRFSPLSVAWRRLCRRLRFGPNWRFAVSQGCGESRTVLLAILH